MRSAQGARAGTFVFAVIFCAMLVPNCAQTPQDPNDPEHGVWNPLDENAPPTVFTPPEARIIFGPADGQRVPWDTVTYAWEPATGHTKRYRRYFDGDSVETTDTTVTFVDLDEGLHEFWVRGLTESGKATPDEKLARRRFTVNALLDPAVYLSPRTPVVPFGEPFSVILRFANFGRADTGRVKGLRVVLHIPSNTDYLGLDSLGYLGQEGGRVFSWTTWQNSLLTFEAARTGDPPVALADSGAVARLRLYARAPGADSIRIVECEVFNGNNRPLAVITRGAEVEVR